MRAMMTFVAVLASASCGAPQASTAPTPAPLAHPVEYSVGLRTLDAVDPLTGAPLAVAVFYPTPLLDDDTPAQSLDGFTVSARRGAALAGGAHPLIAISHGHGGSLWGHHDLAEALARHGYIAVTVEHAGDSWRDSSGFRAPRVLFGRAYQVSAAIDRALAEPDLAAHVDRAKLGVAGFSAGGYTALLVAGAHPDFRRLAGYCQRHPDDPQICDGLGTDLDLTAPRPTADPRIRAAFVMAPFAVPFGPDAFTGVRAPVYLTWGTADRVLLPDENAQNVARDLHTIVATKPIPNAGHFVFLAPCDHAMAKRSAELCTDPPGIDRAAVHADLAAAAVAFFDERL